MKNKLICLILIGLICLSGCVQKEQPNAQTTTTTIKKELGDIAILGVYDSSSEITEAVIGDNSSNCRYFYIGSDSSCYYEDGTPKCRAFLRQKSCQKSSVISKEISSLDQVAGRNVFGVRTVLSDNTQFGSDECGFYTIAEYNKELFVVSQLRTIDLNLELLATQPRKDIYFSRTPSTESKTWYLIIGGKIPAKAENVTITVVGMALKDGICTPYSNSSVVFRFVPEETSRLRQLEKDLIALGVQPVLWLCNCTEKPLQNLINPVEIIYIPTPKLEPLPMLGEDTGVAK